MDRIDDMLFNQDNQEMMKRLMEDSFTRMFNEHFEKKRNVIMYLYLWVSVMENITIRDAFEKYGWCETPIKNDASFSYVDRKKLMNYKEIVWDETKITLIPRKYPIENKMPYRDAAMKLVEIFKEILHLS